MSRVSSFYFLLILKNGILLASIPLAVVFVLLDIGNVDLPIANSQATNKAQINLTTQVGRKHTK